MQNPDFFVTGGTLPADAPSYIERAADRDLVAALLAGEFCYVLDTRQMGKSSLIVRTRARLRAAGIAVGQVDLTSIGTNVTPQEWYSGLLDLVAESLDVIYEAEDQWALHSSLGPAQRWMAALLGAVLQSVPGRVVIFVDEIDATLGLPFSPDDFFAGIRSCYNRRAHEPDLARITFCLVGVAAPSELIREPRLSPFNIGTRIQLSSFTLEECAPLAAGLPDAAMLSRILYWTSGHPYMTQRLCRAVAQESAPGTRAMSAARRVDAVCRDLFFAPRARDADSSLAFVRTRLLNSHQDVADILDVYQQLLRGERTPYAESSGICVELVLSGVARVEGSRLVLRNRIYRHVFNMAWVRENLPGAEVRRQQRAFRRGVARTWLLAASVIAVVGALAIANARNARRARNAEAVAKSAAAYARARSDYADHLVYDFNVIRAMQWYSTDGLYMVENQLDEARPASSSDTDLRGFEWYYLRHVCHSYFHEFPHQSGGVTRLAVSPDGRYLASACTHLDVTVWNIATGKPVYNRTLATGVSDQVCLVWSPDGRQLVLGTVQGYVQVIDTATWHDVARFRASSRSTVSSIAYSHQGALLVTGSNDGTARVWDSRTFHEIRHVTAATGRGIWAVAISPDDKILATGGDDGVARLWDIATGRPLRALRGHSWYIYALAFSPDGKTLATASGDTTAVLWNVADGSQRVVLRGHTSYLYAIAYSPDGKTIATGAWDHSARLWNAQTGAPVRVIESTDSVWALAFCLQGRALAVGSLDSSVRLWSTGDSQLYREIQAGTGRVFPGSYSADGARFATCGEDGVARIWDARTGALLHALPRQPAHLYGALLLGDACRTLETGSLCDWSPHNGTGLAIALAPRPGRIFRALSPDGRLAVEIVPNGRAAIRTVDGSSPPVDLADYCPLENYLFNASGSLVAFHASIGYFVICDTRTGRILMQSEARPVNGTDAPLAFSHDGRLLITRAETGLLQVWNARTGRLLRTISVVKAPIKCAAFTADDSRLAVGANDGNVTLWDTATWRTTITLANHGAFVTGVAFSPDDRQLISTDSAGKVRIWDAPRRVGE
jgi:WD40 repeat protein